ncbi:hypothetical protein BJY27_006044 [Streptomyces rapamycinicus]|uniref:Uncharacterized protein n=2 Tax=Streptomyces rapamycinicus TaxID=1226757 RepID=A0A3L8RKH0_STRRN|nr:hypothetical protein [Streptomyces rapamycinicus]RLV79442.1 hypothetical protein D3C57_113695 [Streptomyces rapamycinicus NRRL 5491]
MTVRLPRRVCNQVTTAPASTVATPPGSSRARTTSVPVPMAPGGGASPVALRTLPRSAGCLASQRRRCGLFRVACPRDGSGDRVGRESPDCANTASSGARSGGAAPPKTLDLEQLPCQGFSRKVPPAASSATVDRPGMAVDAESGGPATGLAPPAHGCRRRRSLPPARRSAVAPTPPPPVPLLNRAKRARRRRTRPTRRTRPMRHPRPRRPVGRGASAVSSARFRGPRWCTAPSAA